MKFLGTIVLSALLVFSASSQTAKSKPAGVKHKGAAAVPRHLDEQTEWDKASATDDPIIRIAALKKFTKTFPKSTRIAEGLASIVTAEAEIGNAKLVGGEPEEAVKFLKAAAADASKPISDQLFTDTLSKFPANLYFRGLRDPALEIAKILEDKAETNVGQLLNIAAFYVSIENGSEARRVAENAVKVDPTSSAAYQTLGLADRVDFKLEESAAAYAKALELEPDSLAARRGLAEMKRSLGKPDEAAALYREILSKDEANLPARTGLILALFDAEKRAEAEAEMGKSLEASPGNVILLAGAAYWYAAHDDGPQAVALAEKAIEVDPRFIWSHIALARGFMSQKKPLDAERTLLAARRYGNFPTLEYEIASARLGAGLYREAAEELAKSFSVKDGVIHSDLGGRVPLESQNFTELVGYERRASIFTPTAADDLNTAAQLRALLEFKQELDSAEPRSDKAADAADEFIRGYDKMKVYRQLYAASALLDKKVAVPKVLEIAKSAPASLEGGLEVPEPATAVMASELYESRSLAAARGQYVNVPGVPRPTLSAILRGRIEEINGWALYQMDDADQAVVHLKRAAGILPVDSAWWRSSNWRLGNALVVKGKDVEALEAYIASYKSNAPDAVRYNAIEAVYKRVNGNTDGLEKRIGSNPSTPAPVNAVSQKTEQPPEIKTTRIPSVVPIKAEPTPKLEVKAEVAPSIPEKTEVPSATEISTLTPPVEAVKEQPKPIETPAVVPVATPAATMETPKAEPTFSATPEEIKPSPTPETLAKSSEESAPVVEKPAVVKPIENSADEKPSASPKELFPPVIITIPAPEPVRIIKAKQMPVEPKPCTLTVSEESITLKNGGGDIAVIIGREDDGDIDGLNAISTSPENVSVRREKIEGVKTRALFVVRSVSAKTGDYQIKFGMPCGKKEITVKVQ